MTGKTAIVTGANRGLGRALTEALATMGAKVLMVCRNEAAGREVERQLREKGLEVTLYVADMGSIADIERLHEAVAAEFDCIDILVNNAAVLLDLADVTIENVSLDMLGKTMNINFRGPLWMCKKFIPLLRKSPSGRIINYSSELGRLSEPAKRPHPIYSISKAAGNALTRILAGELQGTDIIVNSVDPGWVKTNMGGRGAPLSVEEGIDTALWLATEDPQKVESGCVYCRRSVVPW